jgi:hypothetical protein
MYYKGRYKYINRFKIEKIFINIFIFIKIIQYYLEFISCKTALEAAKQYFYR